MDHFVETKLQDWKFEEFIPNFQREGIDEESFGLLDSETLKILIPKAGPRLKFKAHLNSYLSSNDPPSDLPNEQPSLNTSLLSESSIVPLDSPLPYDPLNHNLSALGSNEKRLDLRHIVNRKLPEILRKLDDNDPEKINILDKYKLNRLIVDTYIEKYGCKPTTVEKIDLAKNIIGTFPVLKSVEGEGFEQWFCPGIKGTASSGFIAQRLRNYRQRKLSTTEKAELNYRRNSKSLSFTPISGKEDTSIEFLQKQQWLKENHQPIEKVLHLMRETYEGRRFQISKGLEGNILEAWPRILIPQVIDAKFTEIYGEEKSDSLCFEFGLLSNNIILQARNCGRSSAEEVASKINDLTNPVTSSERICCAIVLLPLLLPQGVISKKKGTKKSKIRPTAAQSLDHFIQFIPIGEGIERFMSEDRLLGGERVQPFILAIGEKFNPVQTFVVIENNLIEVPSLLKAIDICFKLTYVLNLEFSPYCRNVWHFFNEVFYKCEFNCEIPACLRELKSRLFVNIA